MEKRRLIADVFDAVFFQEDVVAFTSDTLQDGNIEVSVGETEVRGGKGNGKIATLHSGRDITVTLTDPVFKYSTLAMQLGQDIVTGAGVGYVMPKKYTVALDGADLKITLEKEPKDATKLKLSIDGTALVVTTDYTLAGNVVTIIKVGVAEGDIVDVEPYAYTTAVTSERIAIDDKTFAKGGKLVLQTIEIDTEENPVSNLFYVFYSAQPSGNFSVNTASEREASATEIELTITKPDSGDEIGYILREPIA